MNCLGAIALMCYFLFVTLYCYLYSCLTLAIKCIATFSNRNEDYVLYHMSGKLYILYDLVSLAQPRRAQGMFLFKTCMVSQFTLYLYWVPKVGFDKIQFFKYDFNCSEYTNSPILNLYRDADIDSTN